MYKVQSLVCLPTIILKTENSNYIDVRDQSLLMLEGGLTHINARYTGIGEIRNLKIQLLPNEVKSEAVT